MRSTGPAHHAPQQFSASFELAGSANAGELTLHTPLGTTLARARWANDRAELTQNGHTHSYASIDALTTALTGETLPLAALFNWLNGEADHVAGWIPNLSQWAQGRISATRSRAIGDTDIRIVFERSDR